MGAKHRSLYGLAPSTVRDALLDPGLSSWSDFDEYSQTLLRVAQNVPVQYHRDWLPEKELHRVRDFEQEIEDLNFSLKYDGSEVRKPTVLMPRDGRDQSAPCFVRRFSHDGPNVSVRGYFYAQHGTIKPEELQGVLIRIRQPAVGAYDSTFLGFPVSEGSLIQRWVSAELWADDRLEDAMNIDRRTLRTAHPAFGELQRVLHKELRAVISHARKHLYEAGSAKRTKARTAVAVTQLQDIVRREVAPVDAAVAADLDASFQRVGRRREATLLSRRVNVAEFYEIVATVARETLPPKVFAKFMRRLTERLNR